MRVLELCIAVRLQEGVSRAATQRSATQSHQPSRPLSTACVPRTAYRTPHAHLGPWNPIQPSRRLSNTLSSVLTGLVSRFLPNPSRPLSSQTTSHPLSPPTHPLSFTVPPLTTLQSPYAGPRKKEPEAHRPLTYLGRTHTSHPRAHHRLRAAHTHEIRKPRSVARPAHISPHDEIYEVGASSSGPRPDLRADTLPRALPRHRPWCSLPSRLRTRDPLRRPALVVCAARLAVFPPTVPRDRIAILRRRDHTSPRTS